MNPNMDEFSDDEIANLSDSELLALFSSLGNEKYPPKKQETSGINQEYTKEDIENLTDEQLLALYSQTGQKKEPLGVAGQFGLGVAETGLGTVGSLLDLFGLQSQRPLSEAQQQMIQTELNAPDELAIWMTDDDDLMPRYQRLPSGTDIQKLAETMGISPEKSESGLGRYARRIGRAVGSAALLPGSGAITPFVGGAAIGQTVEEITGSEFAGDITELVTSLGIDIGKGTLLNKKILPKKDQENLVNVAKKYNIPEEQLAPLLNEDRIAKWQKFGRSEDISEKIALVQETSLGDAFSEVRTAARDLAPVGAKESKSLINGFKDILNDLEDVIHPNTETAQAIKYVSDTISELEKGPITTSKIIGQWRDLNNFVNWSKSGAKSSLGRLKGPMERAIGSRSNEILTDFKMLNELFAKSKKIEKILKPDKLDKLFNIGEIGALVMGLVTFNPLAVGSVIGEMALRRIGQTAVTKYMASPRFQNLSGKLAKAINRGKNKQILQALNAMIRSIKKDFTSIDTMEDSRFEPEY